MPRREGRVGGLVVLRNLGIVARLGALVCTTPMLLGIAIAFRPTERWFALMRPLSLAAIFVTISNTLLGLVNMLVYVSSKSAPVSLNVLAAGLAETLVLPFL